MELFFEQPNREDCYDDVPANSSRRGMRILGEVLDGGLGQAWLNNHLDYFCVFNLGAQRIPESKSSSAICLPDLFSLLQSVVILVEPLPHIDPRVIPADGSQYPHATAVKDSVLDMSHHFAYERYEGKVQKFEAQVTPFQCSLSPDYELLKCAAHSWPSFLTCSTLLTMSCLLPTVPRYIFWVFGVGGEINCLVTQTR